jgi:hypothetical protein
MCSHSSSAPWVLERSAAEKCVWWLGASTVLVTQARFRSGVLYITVAAVAAAAAAAGDAGGFWVVAASLHCL